MPLPDPTTYPKPPGQSRPYPKPTTTGHIPFQFPAPHELVGQTGYSIYGSLTSSNKIPLIALHGGPGIPGSYLRTLSLLHVDHDIPIVLYDQMGCGASTRFRDRAGDAALWTPDLFAAELDNLIRTLGIERFDLLGQSWGGMLATWFVTQGRRESARGLRKLVICDSLASFETWMKVSKELRTALPAETRAVLDRCEAAGETEGNQEYEAAVTEFNRRHQCRLDPLPVELEEAFVAWMEDATVQMTMFGPSDWDISGSLRGFSIEGELCKLTKERVPGGLLLVNGQFDIAQDECMRPFWREATTKTKWVRFALSAHAPQLEETETFIFELGSFLNNN